LIPALQQIIDQFRGTWRFRWPAVLVAVAVAFVGWAVVFSMPDRYEATTGVLVDTRTALKPALQGLATGQDVSVPLDYVRQSLLVDEPLCRMAMQAGIIPGCGTDLGAQQPQLAAIRKRVNLNVQTMGDRSEQNGTAGVTFDITYQDENRSHALNLVGILMNTLVTETLGGKRQGSENAQQFLQTQIQDYEKRLRASEDSLAAFKSRHLGLLPNDDGGYFAQLQKETQAVEDSKTKLLAAQNRRVTLEGQLHGNAAVLASGSETGNGSGGGVGDTLSRIAVAQANLDELLQKFTDKHPDVIAARGALAELKQRRTSEIESLRSGDAASIAASGAGGNPVFRSIQLAINQADVDIADLRSQEAQHETKVHDLRQLLDTAPQIEAEYAQLTRDYDVNKTQYTALLSNYDKSKLGQRADDAGSVRFQVVQPPTVSYVPVSPKRLTLLVEVLLAALAAGAGLAFGLDQLHPVVGSAVALTQLTGLTVLASVGSAFPTKSAQTNRRQVRQIFVAVSCLVCVLLIEVVLSRAGLRLSIPEVKRVVHTWV
jgi:polysaccharide chain length determinant protein (PEP-CTERM system associated)